MAQSRRFTTTARRLFACVALIFGSLALDASSAAAAEVYNYPVDGKSPLATFSGVVCAFGSTSNPGSNSTYNFYVSGVSGVAANGYIVYRGWPCYGAWSESSYQVSSSYSTYKYGQRFGSGSVLPGSTNQGTGCCPSSNNWASGFYKGSPMLKDCCGVDRRVGW
jgi:hypothetical protein